MKKISLFLATYLFSFEINTYFLTLKENYKEYANSQIIDRDYSNFNELTGLGISLEDKFIKGKLEFVTGNATYDGSTQNGNKVKVTENNVYLINGYFSFGNPLSIDIGYRFWNRGKSGYEGDYEEEYYWPYIGISLENKFSINNLIFRPLLSYQKAINPKLKILLGNNPILDLGNTTGFKVELPFYYKVDKSVKIFLFYRYQYWHINASKVYNITINGETYPIFEPESETRNQYLGVGLNFSF